MAGMVVSPSAVATDAGAAVLRAGGTAIEAAIAIGAALVVSAPHFCGLGGDAVWLVADADGKVDCFLGVGQAGTEARAEDSKPIPIRGPGAALTTGGAVDSWGHALAFSAAHWQGKATMAGLLEPAIALASEGIPVSRSHVHWLNQRKAEIGMWPGFVELFVPGGELPMPGDRFGQPQLAASLSAIARHGTRELYEGELAERVAKGLRSRGVPLAAHDLAATRTEQVAPIALRYRDTILHAPPAPTQGLATLMTMGVLQQFDLAGLSESGDRHFHLVVEAIKRAFLVRDGIADPRFALPPGLLPDELIAAAATIGETAMTWPPVFRPADTVFFGAVDCAGRCASVLQSIYFDWGSGVVAGDTGILWHNRGAAFSTVPGHPNGLAPGKRPFMTLNPGLATQAGKPRFVYGTQGADGQPQTLALLLTRLIDFGMSPRDALRAPRFLLGKTFSDARDSLKIEADVGKRVVDALHARGHDITVIAAQSPLAGQSGAIAISLHNTLSGSHDPRGEGTVVGLSDN